MNLSEPMVSLIPGVTGAVLAVLGRTQEPLTGRTIAGLTKPAASQKGVANALAGLVEAGVVDRTDKGRAALFTLNRDHVAADAVVALAKLRDRVVDRIRAEVTGWGIEPVSVTVFGSFVRGEGGPASDVDLLVIRPAGAADPWASQLAGLAAAGRRWTGNPFNLIDVGADELAMFADEGFVRAAAAEGLTVAGVALRRLLRRRSARTRRAPPARRAPS